MNSKGKQANRRLRSRKGMTLVEVLVAMTLLTLIILVFTPLFMNYYKNLRTAGELTQKTYERTSLMERLVANPYKNDTGYETYVAKGNLPLQLSGGGTTVDFNADIEGQLVSESLNDDGSYVSFYTPSTSDTMVCFPAVITDDFLTKDITVVPKGFEFAAAAENKNSTAAHFEVYVTNNTGGRVKVSTNYYDIKYDTDGEGVAIFTFKGGNNVISFENSPMYIQYFTAPASMYKEVKVEIGAPEIILVGEEANDDNYYYYATAGVDTKTGKMDIVAKKMTTDTDGNDVSLVSAMNDVEWVAKGRGDDGNGGVNQYGYYVMGGDAGQVRRFWRNEITGNYYWGGDVLGQYDRYYNLVGNNTVDGNSYETITQTNTTQAQFKSIFHSNLDYYTYNGVQGANQLTADELITIGFEYRMITTNYYTANVSYSATQPYYTTLGRILTLKNGSNEYRYAGNGTELYDQPKGLFTSFVGFRQSANNALRTLMPANNTYSKLNVDGYIQATNYEYQTAKGAKINDKSLITITSVGAVQINTSNPNYYQSTQSTVKLSQAYPTQSYTLYCGTIPAVIDTWGWKTKNVGSLLYNNYSMWLHTGTLGIATDGSYWYPTGKFGDTKTTAETSTANGKLSSSVFGDNVSWSSLLNYGTNSSLYPFGNTATTITTVTQEATGKFIGKHKVEVYFKWTGPTQWSEKTSSETPTTVGTEYSSEREKFCTGALTSLKEIVKIVIDGTYTTNINDRSFYDGKTYTIKIGPNAEDTVPVIYVNDGRRLSFPNEIREAQYAEKTTTTTGYIRYYGPTSDGDGFTTGGISGLTNRSYLGTALPEEGNDYYVSAGHEVDITMGYLSQPYAIDINNPTVPKMSGLSGLTGGSDYYFKKPGDDGLGSSILSGGAFNHSFVSGGLRDNVTMLDIKSFHDDLTGNNISIAAGYTLSYVANDYSYLTRLGQVLNNGVIYIRATGDGTESDTAGDLSSGKGWSLKKETNVFHQFFGIDQYRGVSLSEGGTSAILGWTTTYHKGYLNMSTDSNKAPQASYSPSITEGNNNYGVNYHPLMDTECTTVNWGLTSDFKPQAMWGTSNGTLMSWYYNYEAVTDSKIYSVCKEFENYSWADKLGLNPRAAAYRDYYFDYTSVSRDIEGDYGFISVLKNVNDVCFCDDIWVAVGDQSGKKPSDYCAGYYCYTQSVDCTQGAGNAGSFVNVKFLDKNLKGSDGLPIARWIAVKISDNTDVNIRSVVNCQGVWYLMGYVDSNGNGQNDEGERCVMYWSTSPQNGFRRCATRTTLAGDYTGTSYDAKTYALYYDDNGVLQKLELEGVNKMACQS